MINRREKLSTYQRWMIIILHNELGVNADTLRHHPTLLRSNETPRSKKQIQLVIERFKETGSINERVRSGRKRLLDEKNERSLIRYIKRHRMMFYRSILHRRKYNFNITRRTINRYALRNKISESSLHVHLCSEHFKMFIRLFRIKKTSFQFIFRLISCVFILFLN